MYQWLRATVKIVNVIYFFIFAYPHTHIYSYIFGLDVTFCLNVLHQSTNLYTYVPVSHERSRFF